MSPCEAVQHKEAHKLQMCLTRAGSDAEACLKLDRFSFTVFVFTLRTVWWQHCSVRPHFLLFLNIILRDFIREPDALALFPDTSSAVQDWFQGGYMLVLQLHPEACHYLCDVSSDRAALQMFSTASSELQCWKIDEDDGKKEWLVWVKRVRKLGESW